MPRRFNKVTWSISDDEYLSRHKGEPVNQLCIALDKSRSAVTKRLAELNDGKPATGPRMRPGKRTNIGKRPDCDNTFLRSGWESNIYRYLKLQNQLVAYEPHTFSFAPFGVLKGTVSYCPDFEINHPKYKYLEVKGFLKREDKTKIKRFLKYYKEDAARLCVVTGSPKTAATKFFQELGIPIYAYYQDLKKAWKDKIPGWEG